MKKLKYSILLFSIAIFISYSHSAFAISIYPDKEIKEIPVGNPYLIKILINTDGQEINAIEGIIKINNLATVSSVNTGGSIFNLWPESPKISTNQEINFTGGTEGGIYGKDLRLLNFTVTPSVVGDINISSNNLFVYLNDGNGTKIKVSDLDFNVKSVRGELDISDNIEKDEMPPMDFNIDLGKDDFVYDGKYFITFNAVDETSGLNRYEVKEGDTDYVISGNTYVLKDQTLKTKVYVRAIDNAGNQRVESFDPQNNKIGLMIKYSLYIILILLIIYRLFNLIKIKNDK